MTGTERVASRLRETTSQANLIDMLLELYADEIDMAHTPRVSIDGPWTHKAMVALAHTEQAAFAKSLPATSLRQLNISVERDRIDYSAEWTGKRADGSDVEITMVVQFWVRDGKIVAQNQRMEPEMGKKYGELLAAGGFTPELLVEKMQQAGMTRTEIDAMKARMSLPRT
jgi:hypothetical protein